MRLLPFQGDGVCCRLTSECRAEADFLNRIARLSEQGTANPSAVRRLKQGTTALTKKHREILYIRYRNDNGRRRAEGPTSAQPRAERSGTLGFRRYITHMRPEGAKAFDDGS